MNLVLLKNISIIGIYWGAYTTKEPSHVPVVWDELLSSVSNMRYTAFVSDLSLDYLEQASCSRSFTPQFTPWNRLQMALQLWKVGNHGAKLLPELETMTNQIEKPTYDKVQLSLYQQHRCTIKALYKFSINGMMLVTVCFP